MSQDTVRRWPPRLRCDKHRAAERLGQPLELSEVYLRVAWKTASGSLDTFWLTRTSSDKDGKFEFLGLCPGDHYDVTVDSDDYDSIETPQVTGEAGGTHDFGALKMTTPRSVAGKVMASVSTALTWLAEAIHSAGDGRNPETQ